MGQDLHHSTVVAWEHKLAASLLAANQEYHRQHFRSLVDEPRCSGRRWAIYSYRADATNGNVWQRSKLHVVEVASSIFSCGHIDYSASVRELQSKVETTKRFADLQVVGAGMGNAEGATKLIKKQITSLGVPSWEEGSQRSDRITRRIIGDEPLDSIMASTFVNLPLLVYTAVTDAGPDQVGSRAAIRRAVASKLLVLFVDGNCLEHQCHLIVKFILTLVDAALEDLCEKAGAQTVRYFASLAKLMNTWREYARSIFDTWRRVMTDAAAWRWAANVPPKCIAGRWGSADDSESFLLARPWEDTSLVLHIALAKRKQSATKTKASGS